MSEIKLQKINNVKVVPVLHAGNMDTRPVKGSELFPEVYANIGIIAKKKSGKTQVIYKVIQSCCGKSTKVVIFSSTIHKDPTYQAIKKWCKKHSIVFEGFTDIMEGKVNILDNFINKLGQEGAEYDLDDSMSESEDEHGGKPGFFGDDGEGLDDKSFSESEEDQDESDPIFGKTKTVEQPKFDHKRTSIQPKSKYQEPEWIVIFDDMSHALKSPSIASLLKKNRHYKMKVVISSQYLHDLKPESFKQMDYLLLFKGLSEPKLEKVITDADLNIEQSTLDKVYHHATLEPFNFLYIDTRQDGYRKNFDKQYIIHSNK
jgi:hypothetical protein